MNNLRTKSLLTVQRLIAALLIGLVTGNVVVGYQESVHYRGVTKAFTEPIEMSVVACSENGVIQSTSVVEGSRVHAGQVLAVLSHDVLLKSRTIAVERSESTAALEAAMSKVEVLNGQKQKLEALLARGHANSFEVEQKTIEFNNAVAQYRAEGDKNRLAGLEVDRIDAQIAQRTIRAPIDGFVTEIHKQRGEYISGNDPGFCTVVKIDQLKASFYLDEAMLSTLHTGDKVEVLLGPDAIAGKAEILYLSPVINPESRTGKVDVRIDNLNHAVRSGTVCVWNGLESRAATLEIPLTYPSLNSSTEDR